MFWKENVRFCKDCKHYQSKDWSLNMECKLGKKTSAGGNTGACDRFEQQFSLFGGNYQCKDCARWEDVYFGGRCIKGLPTPKGRNSDACSKYFVKG